MRLIIIIISCLLLFFAFKKNAYNNIDKEGFTKSEKVKCIYGVDFYDSSYKGIWNQNCQHYGVASGSRTILNSLNIKCLFEVEKEYNKELKSICGGFLGQLGKTHQRDTESTCYYLYKISTNTYLNDTEFTSDGVEIKYAKELTEILELYKTHIELSNNLVSIKTTNSPLTGSDYCWRAR